MRWSRQKVPLGCFQEGFTYPLLEASIELLKRSVDLMDTLPAQPI
jgi:hypothetical protein